MEEKGNQRNKIKEIFETMQYADDTENTTEATEWLKTKENRIFAYIDSTSEKPNGEQTSIKNANNDELLCNIYVPDATTVDVILNKFGTAKNTWNEVSPVKKSEILYRLGTEIEKKQNLFIQLEVAGRGLLKKDSKKELSLLTDLFHYYSSFTTKASQGNSTWKPQGVVVGIVSDYNSISALGCLLGPSLAAGYKIALQIPPRLSPVATLLSEIAVQVGVPEGTLRLLPGSVDKSTFFIHPQVSIVTIFDNLYNEEYFVGNHLSKKLLNIYSPGIPMLVFEDADLDSACHSIIDAAWGHQGTLPWAVRSVLVQENIFENFTKKLKQKIEHVKVGFGNKINVDVSYPGTSILAKLKNIIDKAKNEGVEVFQPNPDSVIPTLLIGGNVFNNNVIKEDTYNIPIVTLTAFRTINEAVALANNTRQGLAASVWSENNSLLNEIMRKLKFANIWVNSHGLFASNISTTPYKSGSGSFGGGAGFNEYIHLKELKDERTSKTNNGEAMEKAINEAKAGLGAWNKLTRFEREKILQNIAQKISSTKNLDLSPIWLDEWIELIYDYISNFTSSGSTELVKGYNVMSVREPCGIIAVETMEGVDSHNKRLILGALMQANSLIILNDSKAATAFYTLIASLLPKGVLTVVEHSRDSTQVAALHKELNVYFGEKRNQIFRSLPLKSSRKFRSMNETTWEEVLDKVTLVKNVWFNVGQSFI